MANPCHQSKADLLLLLIFSLLFILLLYKRSILVSLVHEMRNTFGVWIKFCLSSPFFSCHPILRGNFGEKSAKAAGPPSFLSSRSNLLATITLSDHHAHPTTVLCCRQFADEVYSVVCRAGSPLCGFLGQSLWGRRSKIELDALMSRMPHPSFSPKLCLLFYAPSKITSQHSLCPAL